MSIDRIPHIVQWSYSEQIEAVARLLEDVRQRGNTVYWAGNGGSADSCNHMAFDIPKEHFRKTKKEPQLKSISLCSNTGWITAIANDLDYESVFLEQLKTLGTTNNDVLVLLTGSGNSRNILEVAWHAKQKRMQIVGLTGFDGGDLGKAVGAELEGDRKPILDYHINVPLADMGMIESSHLMILHLILNRFKEL